MTYGEFAFLVLMSLGIAAYPSYMVARILLHFSRGESTALPVEQETRTQQEAGTDDFAAEGGKPLASTDWQIDTLDLALGGTNAPMKDLDSTDVVVELEKYKKRRPNKYAQQSSA